MSDLIAEKKVHAFLLKLSPLPDEEWLFFKKHLELKEFKKGQYFLRAGELPQQIGFIINGLFRKYYLTDDGREFIKDFSFGGKVVTSYSALLQSQASIMNIEAVEDTHLFQIAYNFWITLYERHQCWQQIGRKITESIFIEREQRERELLIYNATERYEVFNLKYPQLKDRLPQYDIASYLGISPISLSRIVSKSKNK